MSGGDRGELLSVEFTCGTVWFWLDAREFGVIKADRGRDVHVSRAAVERCLNRTSLEKGERLRFRIRSFGGSNRRPTAWDLKLEDAPA